MEFDIGIFRQILEAARTREASSGVDTMIVASHLAQMRLFMLRQGVEFFAQQDTFSQRRDFIRRVVDYNELPCRLEAIVDSFLIDGKGLLYFRPSRDLYKIHFFTRDQYRTYYDEEGELEEVQIVYSYKVRPPRGFASQLGMDVVSRRVPGMSNAVSSDIAWVRLKVRMDTIEQTTSPTALDFDGPVMPTTQVIVNSLGFIPAQEVFNNRGLEAGTGYGEFDWLASYILQHDKMVKNIKGNLDFFGNPTLVSSRPKHDLIEPDSDNSQRPTVASGSGFVGLNRVSTRVSAPTGSGMGGVRVPRVIANVEAADRVNYIVPDAVSGDLTGYAQMYQEMVRAALGGVDDLSINSGATAYEVRTLYGRVAATARAKCRDLFTYGFCRLFSMMVFQEETLFRESLAQALGYMKPPPVLEEEVPPEQLEKVRAKYEKDIAKWRDQVNASIQEIKETGDIPPAVVGLIPDGDARIDWRWTGEIFEDSPQEILQKSIVCRNLQELGVSSIEALQHLLPQKTPEERAAMLSGYPFRMVEATQRSVGIFMDILRGMFQVPHPQEPNLPLAADPNLDLVPYLYRTLSFLRKELSYSGTYSDVDPANLPPTLSDADRLRATRGAPTAMDRERQQRRNRPAGVGPAGAPNAGGAPGAAGQLGFGQPMAPGVQSARRLVDADVPLPGLGGTLSYDPSRPEPGPGWQLGAGANGPAPGGIGAFGVGPGAVPGGPDLLAPTNAGLPFPAGDPAAGVQPGPRGSGQPRQGRGRPPARRKR